MLAIEKRDNYWVLRLADNTEVVLREARGSEDKDRVLDFYKSLDRDTIYSRFLHITRNFEPIVSKTTNPETGVCIIAEIKGQIVGLGEAVYIDGKKQKAEVAVIVKPEWRRRKIGTALMFVLRELGVSRGVKWGYATIFAHNFSALRIAKKFGAITKKINMHTIYICVPLTGEPEGCW